MAWTWWLEYQGHREQKARALRQAPQLIDEPAAHFCSGPVSQAPPRLIDEPAAHFFSGPVSQAPPRLIDEPAAHFFQWIRQAGTPSVN